VKTEGNISIALSPGLEIERHNRASVSLKSARTGITLKVKEVHTGLVLLLSIPDSYLLQSTERELAALKEKMQSWEMSPPAVTDGTVLRLRVPLSPLWQSLTENAPTWHGNG